MPVILILGMHRSGTSCLANMLVSGGAVVPGVSIRNWDNRRGHFEANTIVRLNEAILAASGVHWLAPPQSVQWTSEHAAQRDNLLTTTDTLTVYKDPRTLLCLPCWRESSLPWFSIGIIRHPLSVARSLMTWRGMTLDESLSLWLSHNVALDQDQQRFQYPLLDFSQTRTSFINAVTAAAEQLSLPLDNTALAAGYADELVHHDTEDAPDGSLFTEALALYHRLQQRCLHHGPQRVAPPFPRAALTRCLAALDVNDLETARAAAIEAAETCQDVSAVIVPLVTAALRRQSAAWALSLLAAHNTRMPPDLLALCRGKCLFALHDNAAVEALHAACATQAPLYEAQLLLPHAYRRAGQHRDAEAAMRSLALVALYPHGPLAQLAEWANLDHDQNRAIDLMADAIAAAPQRRRGRLRTRRAEWLLAADRRDEAIAELQEAKREDPLYTRADAVLRNVTS